MESKTSSQAKARLVIAAVFVIGFAAGALSLNLYQKFTSNAPIDPHDRAGLFIQRIDEKVGLSDAQKAQIRQILENSRDKMGEIHKKMEPTVKELEPQFDAVRQQTRNEIRGVLNDAQLPKVEEMFKEKDDERERMQQEEKERHKK